MEVNITVLDALVNSLQKATEYNKNDQVPPAVILWTDKERQWEALAPTLHSRLPQFLTLGAYDPTRKSGPAIWLRCMIARTLPEADWPEDATPIMYLPGVSRQELRAVEDCPRSLQPLAELQYRGRFWAQLNAKDWTLLAFLQSKDGGLGLDVARDAATQDAMKGALLKLLDMPITELRGKRLEAADFHALLLPDPVRDLLQWLNDPDRARAQWDARQWEAFRNVCKETSGFDPQTEGALTGGEKLGRRQGIWK